MHPALSAPRVTSARRLCALGLTLGIAAAWLLPGGTTEANQIDIKLKKSANQIVSALETAKYKNVGVLPFQVQVGANKPTFHFGDLNKLMAFRVGNMLILANTEKNPMGIIPDAGKQAGQVDKNSTWRTAADRAKLFDHTYTLPWQEPGKSNKVKADAFLAGMVETSKDFKTSTVRVMLFDKKNTELREIAKYTVPTERSTLLDMNVGFKVEIKDLNTNPNDLTIDAANNQGGGGDNPSTINKTKAPYTDLLDLKVFYDDKEMDITNNALPVPKADTKVSFKMASKKGRIAVLLMVNGLNTVGSDERWGDRDLEEYSRWVLEGGKTYGVYGFQKDAKTSYAFVAKPPEQVAATDFVEAEKFKIQIVVFAETDNVASDSPKVQFRTQTTALNKGGKSSLRDLQNAIMNSNKVTTANLIAPGGPMDLTIETTTFKGIAQGFGTLTYGASGGNTTGGQ